MDTMIKSPETLMTIIIAFLVIFVALLAMAIGWILTKKTDFFKNRCGWAPKGTCKKDKTSCQICKKDTSENNDKENSDADNNK